MAAGYQSFGQQLPEKFDQQVCSGPFVDSKLRGKFDVQEEKKGKVRILQEFASDIP